MRNVDFESVNDVLLALNQLLITRAEARELLGMDPNERVPRMELKTDLSPEEAEDARKEWLAAHDH